jgi:hypothetical protein
MIWALVTMGIFLFIGLFMGLVSHLRIGVLERRPEEQQNVLVSRLERLERRLTELESKKRHS